MTITATGLSTTDVDEIRRQLDAGRRPKVVFTAQAGQIAGQTGQVVRLADPQHGEEWVVVRFGKDELPFSPADLAVPPRGGKPARRPQPDSKQPDPKQTKSTVKPDPGAGTPVPGQRDSAAAAASDRAATDARTSGPAQTGDADPANPAASKAAGKAASNGAGGGTARTATASSAKPATNRGARGSKGRTRPPAAMTVTLAYQEGEWTVAAHQGSKVLAKPYLVRPAEALQMVSMLDVAGVREAVEQIVAAEFAEAQQRAEALRGELAEVEAKLAELRGTG